MFTGLVMDVGTVVSRHSGEDGARLEIESRLVEQLVLGASIAVDGVCLTVTGLDSNRFSADVMNQTLDLTGLGSLSENSKVNLEPAARVGDHLGGHIVQGHVDGLAKVKEIRPDGFARRIALEADTALGRYIVERGSVTLNGVSLTVAEAKGDDFAVSLIPETLERTNLIDAAVGSTLNLECDVIARYVERLLGERTGKESTGGDPSGRNPAVQN